MLLCKVTDNYEMRRRQLGQDAYAVEQIPPESGESVAIFQMHKITNLGKAAELLDIELRVQPSR